MAGKQAPPTPVAQGLAAPSLFGGLILGACLITPTPVVLAVEMALVFLATGLAIHVMTRLMTRRENPQPFFKGAEDTLGGVIFWLFAWCVGRGLRWLIGGYLPSFVLPPWCLMLAVPVLAAAILAAVAVARRLARRRVEADGLTPLVQTADGSLLATIPKTTVCRCCGEPKKHPNAGCPQCGFTDWSNILVGWIISAACLWADIYWFTSPGWIIAAWIVGFLFLALASLFTIDNLAALSWRQRVHQSPSQFPRPENLFLGMMVGTIILIVGCILPTFFWLENPRAIAVAWLAATALTSFAISGLGRVGSPAERFGCAGIFVVATLAIPILIVAGRYEIVLTNLGQCLASAGVGAFIGMFLFPILAQLPNFDRRAFSKTIYYDPNTGQKVGESDWKDDGLQNSTPRLEGLEWPVAIGLGAYLGAIVGLIIWVQTA